MDSQNEQLKPGKHFPENMLPPKREDVLSELAKYGCAGQEEIHLIDTTHDAEDIRLNYIIDKRWVLRFCNAPEMSETRLRELNRLIGRYRDFGLKCPSFLADGREVFFHQWHGLTCYLSEYVDLPTAEDLPAEEKETLWQEVLDSVALFAERNRNVDLSDTMGMYSLFDLAPFDKSAGKDEKQQNFDELCEALRKMNETALAERLETKHAQVREKLRAVYRELPRCVFQADENLSNVLIDEKHHMAGWIDFNLAGTEVVVNQFANLGGGFDELVKEPIGAKTRLNDALDSYRRYQERMLTLYHATDLEKQAMRWYTWIALVAGWPQVCFFLDGLKDDALRVEILELLSLLTELPVI